VEAVIESDERVRDEDVVCGGINRKAARVLIG
jgi:hypothetical protein